MRSDVSWKANWDKRILKDSKTKIKETTYGGHQGWWDTAYGTFGAPPLGLSYMKAPVGLRSDRQNLLLLHTHRIAWPARSERGSCAFTSDTIRYARDRTNGRSRATGGPGVGREPRISWNQNSIIISTLRRGRRSRASTVHRQIKIAISHEWAF